MNKPEIPTRPPWKFINNYKKIVIPIEKVKEYSAKNKWIIVDTRTKKEYKEKHLKHSIHVSWATLKKFILSNAPSKKILLIARNERTYVNIVAWARAMKYKHIYLLKGGTTAKINKKYF